MVRNNSERTRRAFVHDSTRREHYAPRAGDVVIATRSKCGATRMQRSVGLLVSRSPAPCPVMEISPWVDASFVLPAEAMRSWTGAF